MVQCPFSALQCIPVHCEGDLSSFKWKTRHKINTSLLMLREWTYTAPLIYTRPSSQLRSADQTHRHPFQWSFRCLDVFGQKNMMDLSLVSNHLWFAWMPVLLTPPLAPWRPNLFKYSFLLAKQSYDWRRKGSAELLYCVWVPLHSVTPQEQPG